MKNLIHRVLNLLLYIAFYAMVGTHLMPHPGTDLAVVAALDAFAREIGQVPIHYKREYHGYIFNSIFGAMRRQALDLVIEGVASVEDIDRSWMGIYKMTIGPFGPAVLNRVVRAGVDGLSRAECNG